MPGRNFHAKSASTSLSTTPAVITIGAAGDPVPDESFLSLVLLQLSSISGATEVTWFVTADSAGDIPITPERTSTIVTGKTTAAKGSVSHTVDVEWKRDPDITASGCLYVVASLDAGTASAVGRAVGAAR